VNALDGAASLQELGLPAVQDLTAGGALAAAVAGLGVAGVGVDAVDLDRFRRVLGRRSQLADRLFTSGELAYARRASDPVPRLSTRFAAKEATMKALGVGLGAFSFVEVEVVRADLDPPALVLHGTARALADGVGVTRWHLALTHTHRVAMAMVVAVTGAVSAPVEAGPEVGAGADLQRAPAGRRPTGQ
jgi:holo-[acyl-carrier protein] synthase